MATPKAPAPGHYVGLVAILTSAAGAVVAVFALFNSVLQELVPPLRTPGITVSWVSMGSLVLLLALTVVLRQVKRNREFTVAAIVSVLFAVASFAIYLPYASQLRSSVFQIPPPPAPAWQRFIQGEIHAKGLERLNGRSVAQFVSQDPEGVINSELLWTRESQEAVTSDLELRYVGLVICMVCALFMASLSVWIKSSRTRTRR
ncbi:hypothetical protein BH10PSE17_BH10PSE17_03550 [soil metagenome]